MYGLYGWLLAKGEIVYLNTKVDIPAIGVYPEIFHGNDQEAVKVVRYILQTPGVMSFYGVPGPSTEEIKATSDEIIVFSKIYDTINVKADNVLFLPILNLHVFKDKKGLRTKSCFLVGKGTNQFKHPPDAIELTRQFAQDQEALADLLNECQTLYCYDRLSAMMDIARLCGCKVQYYGGFSEKELELYEPGRSGIGYHGEDTELNSEWFREGYVNLAAVFSERLDRFIERTQA